MKTLTLLLFVAMGIQTATSQVCRDEHSYCDRGEDKNFQLSNQSKSGPFAKGEEHEMSMILYNGVDYRISLCSSAPELEGKIEFEIYTMKTEKKYDERKKRMAYVKVPEVLYSNREDEMAQSIEFQSDGTKKIFLKVYVPEGASEGKSRKLTGSGLVCVGVLVLHQKGIKTGFGAG